MIACLYVKGIPKKFDAAKLEKVFSEFGQVTGVTLKENAMKPSALAL